MQRKIIWSPEIFLDLENLIEFLQNNWPAQVTENFYETLMHKIALIEAGVVIGRTTIKDQRIHSILITKHNRLYYEENEETLFLLRLFDTRQNPVKNPFE